MIATAGTSLGVCSFVAVESHIDTLKHTHSNFTHWLSVAEKENGAMHLSKSGSCHLTRGVLKVAMRRED